MLFGGFDDVAYLDDTWTWDGTDWTQRTPAHTPGPRAVSGMAWDSVRRQAVLFGGYSYGGPLGDTWTWDGTDWTKRAPAHAPPARSFMGMGFDDGHGQAVVFGGTPQGNEEALDDTWTWDGTDWTQRFPRHAPTTRLGPALAFDGLRSDMVLFGGFDPNNAGYLDDTWTWDGTDWTTHLDASIDLNPRSGHPGSLVTVAGRGFAAGELIRLTFVDSTLGVVPLKTVQANAGGAFAEYITVPNGATPGPQRSRRRAAPAARPPSGDSRSPDAATRLTPPEHRAPHATLFRPPKRLAHPGLEIAGRVAELLAGLRVRRPVRDARAGGDQLAQVRAPSPSPSR